MNTLILNKVLPILVLPMGASLLMLAAALRWRKRVLIALPLVLLFLFSLPVVADVLVRSLEERYAAHRKAEYPEADAVFALGGMGVRRAPDGEAVLSPSGERFYRALELFNAGRARMIVLSAAGPPRAGQLGEGAHLREIALGLGIPAESIILTGEVVNTVAEANALSELATRNHWKRVLLVTSAIHMPRAIMLFRRCPVEIVPVPVDFQAFPGTSSGVEADKYLPQGEALGHSEKALREYLGMLFYSVVR